MDKLRLDKLLFTRGLAGSREKAQALIIAGEVKVNGNVVTKPGAVVTPEVAVEIIHPHRFVSRGGLKLEFALNQFSLDVSGLTCADFGSNVGGFVGVLLEHGAKRVYSVETGYGVLDWKLRNDPRVIVMERMNAMHVTLPEKVDFISIDVSWTPQLKVLPNAINNLKEGGNVVSLVKPHYEATSRGLKLMHGKLNDDQVEEVAQRVATEIEATGLKVVKLVKSPITGGKAGNIEYLFWLKL